MAQYFPMNYIQQNNHWNPLWYNIQCDPMNMHQNSEWNPMWNNNVMFHGQQQINTTVNYQCQYIMYPYVVYPIPQYFYYTYYTPQQIPYTPPYNTNVPIQNNCPSTSDGYTSCVECRDNGIQTNVTENDSISIQTDNVQRIDFAIQSDIATQNTKAIQTLCIESKEIEIQSDLVTLNSVSVQTEMNVESVDLVTSNDPNPCISTNEDVSQSEESEEKEDNFIFVMESTDSLNLRSCLRARSAYEEEVTEGLNHRPEIKREIRFNDWLNKVKLI